MPKRKKLIFGFYHIAMMNHYKSVVKAQVNRIIKSELYKNTTRIYVGVVGGKLDIKLPPKFEIIYQSDDVKKYEFPTCNKFQNECMVWYIHTKGVSYHSSNKKRCDHCKKWRNTMEKYVIDNYKKCISALDEYDACGWTPTTRRKRWKKALTTARRKKNKMRSHKKRLKWRKEFKKLKLEMNPKYKTDSSVLNDMFHFLGNFWWANSSHIRELSDLKSQNQSNRYLCEGWISQCKNPKLFDLKTIK